VVDETHHLLPASLAAGELLPLGNGQSALHITARPNLVAPAVLQKTSLLVAIGEQAQALIEEFCQASGVTTPPMDPMRLEAGEALAWRPRVAGAHATDDGPFRLNIATAVKPAMCRPVVRATRARRVWRALGRYRRSGPQARPTEM
jgi:hypothetical protein